jgi:hypothetical protein
VSFSGRLKKCICTVAAVAVIAAMAVPALPLQAYTGVDKSRKGTLTVSMEDAVSGAAFHIFKIGSFGDNGSTFVASDAVGKLNVDLGDDKKIELNSGKWSEYCETLSAYAHEPYMSEALPAQETDAAGSAVFQNVETGVYLVTGDRMEKDGKAYDFSPLLVAVPTSADGKTWDYDVDAQAKYETSPANVKAQYSVTKHWKSDGGEGRPDSIDVLIERRERKADGSYGSWEEFKTKTLSDDNDWTYKWPDETGAQFRVSEDGTVRNDDGTKYRVSVNEESETQSDGTVRVWFTLTNRKREETPPDHPSTPPTPPGNTPGQPTTPQNNTPNVPDQPTDTPTGGEIAGASRGKGQSGTIMGAYRMKAASAVRTGDESNMTLWLILMIAVGVLLVVWGIAWGRQKKDKG